MLTCKTLLPILPSVYWDFIDGSNSMALPLVVLKSSTGMSRNQNFVDKSSSSALYLGLRKYLSKKASVWHKSRLLGCCRSQVRLHGIKPVTFPHHFSWKVSLLQSSGPRAWRTWRTSSVCLCSTRLWSLYIILPPIRPGGYRRYWCQVDRKRDKESRRTLQAFGRVRALVKRSLNICTIWCLRVTFDVKYVVVTEL